MEQEITAIDGDGHLVKNYLFNKKFINSLLCTRCSCRS